MPHRRYSRLTMVPALVLSALVLVISWGLGETSAAILWLIIVLVQLVIVLLLEVEFRHGNQKLPVRDSISKGDPA